MKGGREEGGIHGWTDERYCQLTPTDKLFDTININCY